MIQLSYLHVKHEPNDITMIVMMIMAINLLMMEISRKCKLVLIQSYILMPAKKENITIRTILVALRRHVVIRLYYASSLADEIGGQHSSPQNWCQDMQTWSQNPTCKFDVNCQICLLRPVGRNLSLKRHIMIHLPIPSTFAITRPKSPEVPALEEISSDERRARLWCLHIHVYITYVYW